MRRETLIRSCGLLLALTLVACAAYKAQHASRRPAAAAGGHDHATLTLLNEAAAVKARLHQEGKYACCIEPACAQCLLASGECHCREEIRQGGPGCGECIDGWIEGKGTVEGVNAGELLERKKRGLEQHH